MADIDRPNQAALVEDEAARSEHHAVPRSFLEKIWWPRLAHGQQDSNLADVETVAMSDLYGEFAATVFEQVMSSTIPGVGVSRRDPAGDDLEQIIIRISRGPQFATVVVSTSERALLILGGSFEGVDFFQSEQELREIANDWAEIIANFLDGNFAVQRTWRGRGYLEFMTSSGAFRLKQIAPI